MHERMPFLQWVRRGAGAVFCAMLAVSAIAAEALFPKPLHLVRKIDDPVAGTAITIHEYCAGNRIATVNGERVAIVDYDAQRIIEIDRAALTFSVTRFDEVASVQPRGMSAPPAMREPRLEIAVDERVELSRDAVEALIGAAYPHQRRPEHDAILRAARGTRERIATDATRGYALPASIVTNFDFDGQPVVVRNTIVSVSHEPAPPILLAIPAGARQVESRATRAARELRALDSLPR